jgi:hypothetical protein
LPYLAMRCSNANRVLTFNLSADARWIGLRKMRNGGHARA